MNANEKSKNFENDCAIVKTC